MLGQFSGIASIIKLKPIAIDNIVFRLHYKFTTVALLVCSVLVCSRQYIGEHIRCTGHGVSDKIFDSYCFITAAYSVTKHLNGTVGKTVLHPGVGPHKPGDDIIRHHYYQWVPFVLLLQGILFFLPHYLWKSFEGFHVERYVHGLQYFVVSSDNDVKWDKMVKKVADDGKVKMEKVTTLVPSREKKGVSIGEMASYFYATMNSCNRSWARKMIFCEFLNFVNVVGNIFFTNFFLGGEFTTYGLQVFNFLLVDPEDRVDPMNKVFPKMAKCIFRLYGPSGSIQENDALCVMALNIINEKIYVFLWFWFVILSALSGLVLLWRFVGLIFHKASGGFAPFIFIGCCRAVSPDPVDVAVVTRRSSFSDWLLLRYLDKNMDPVVYSDLISKIAQRIQLGWDVGI